MKQFEKWIEQKTFYHKDTELHIAASFAWKAALKWAAMRGMHHYGNDFLTEMSELSTEIEIELGMLDENGKVIK